MLKKLLKNTKFRSEINSFFRKNKKEIIDIILFGSIVKGKEKPKDIDILLVYKTKADLDTSYGLTKSLERQGFKVSITSKAYKDIFKPAFIAREAVLSEGYSLINNTFISEGLGYSNLAMFRYSLKGLSKSERMRFYYSLYGRGKDKGMLHKLKSNKFSNEIIISPVSSIEEMRTYLDSWKIKYIEMPVLIPSRIVESEVFK